MARIVTSGNSYKNCVVGIQAPPSVDIESTDSVFENMLVAITQSDLQQIIDAIKAQPEERRPGMFERLAEIATGTVSGLTVEGLKEMLGL